VDYFYPDKIAKTVYNYYTVKQTFKELFMETMKAYVCRKYGPPEVLELKQMKRPVINKTELLIKVYSTSATNSDIFIRSSKVSRQFIIPFRIMMGFFGPRKKVIGQVFFRRSNRNRPEY